MKSLASFSDIKHRLEIVKTVNEITWINDSKSTDAGATAFSLENLEGPIIWLVGFSENKRNLDLVNQLAQEKVSEIICYGNFETELKYYFAAKIKYGYKKRFVSCYSFSCSKCKAWLHSIVLSCLF
jgi:UDP-N-acetylmuramoylalanine--D-glutamate ligase